MNKDTNTWKKALSGICALTMVFGIAASPAYAMEDMTEPNMSITNHPNSMIPTKLVTPVGNKAFYKVQDSKVIYADRDDGTGWQADSERLHQRQRLQCGRRGLRRLLRGCK